MISRLLLVGMVGVLGISFPDASGWGTGSTSTRTGATACEGRREAVAFEPIAVDEDPFNRFADELNRRSEGLDLTTAPIVAVATRPRSVFVPVPSGDSVDLKLVAAFCRMEEETETRVIDAPRPIPRPFATEANDVVDQLFAENQVWGDPMTVEMASNNPPAAAPHPSFEPIAVAETDTSLADALNREAEGFDTISTEAEATTLTHPTFEPIAVADDSSSLADELDRASEDGSIEPEADEGIDAAVRLTRSAAQAWMNVLTETMPASADSR
jgi:hypothetical protein